jgi:UDP-glucose 4-epimerase
MLKQKKNSKVLNLEGEKWLFIGGAGFVGSNVVHEFRNFGASCFVLDNLVTGRHERIAKVATLLKADSQDEGLIHETLNKFEITGVVHLAAFMQARESVLDPEKYWSNNLGAVIGLGKSLKGTKVRQVILSSSCSVYGDVENATEKANLNPQSPYAATKVASEQILFQMCNELSINAIALRYFNVIGAGGFEYGCDLSSGTILPSTLRRILMGEKPRIYGSNFSTKDGTCIRDYIDVRDLASAHRMIAKSDRLAGNATINVSTGVPRSVYEIVSELLRNVTGELEIEYLDPMIGDPANVSAYPSKHLEELGWKSEISFEKSVKDFYESFTKYNF